MANRKLIRAVQALFRQIWKLSKTLTKGLITWLLRAALVTQRPTRGSVAGFVLPTTVLLLLVVSLTVGAITYRAFSRTSQSIADRRETMVYNAATPVLDRAKAKIEYLLREDSRLPGGVPSDINLEDLLINDGTGGFAALTTPRDPYLLPGETRVSIGTDTTRSHAAWTYQIDTNGDNIPETVAYSIMVRDRNNAGTVSNQPSSTSTDEQKARERVTRNGPLNLGGVSANPLCPQAQRNPEGGWYPDGSNSSKVLKVFQVDAVVISGGGSANRTVTTLEMQQDRQMDRGNKWGAWFRNDLEIFPGPVFRWNGAMHTRGNLIIGSENTDRFIGYMISSDGSCVYRQDASEITVTSEDGFDGQIINGSLKENDFDGQSNFHIWNGSATNPLTGNEGRLSRTTDSIATEPPAASGGASPDTGGVAAIALDPIQLVTQDLSRPRVAPGASWTRDTGWDTADTRKLSVGKNRRVLNRESATPYLDDTYRADNRFGPKAVYDKNNEQVKNGTPVGTEINAAAEPDLVNDTVVPPATAESVGLDGYWERRARVEGLRVIVGQRLELGNPFGWVTPIDNNNDGDTLDSISRTMPPLPAVAKNATFGTGATQIQPLPEMWGDPLYPPDRVSTSINERQNEARQRRTLRDNLAAVQSSTVYQWNAAGNLLDYPLACLASTVHPGTQDTLDRSTKFVPVTFAGSATGSFSSRDSISLLTNFFLGKGTNGWEFQSPRGTITAFETDINNSVSDLRKGLRNLAYFAGDPRGGFPAVQEQNPPVTANGGTGRSIAHPYPRLTMWGDYSELRRVMDKLDGRNPDGTAATPVAYANLSPADKTTLHTAACTLGMLAYNVRTVEQFDLSNPLNSGMMGNTSVMDNLATALQRGLDNNQNDQIGFLPTPGGPASDRRWTQFRYSSYPPEAYIHMLMRPAFAGSLPKDNNVVRLAELIYLNYQIRRDRLYGFRGSPAFFVDYYAYTQDPNYPHPTNPATLTEPAPVLVPLACHPDDFLQVIPGTDSVAARKRFALTRLCGEVRFKAALNETTAPTVIGNGTSATPTNAKDEFQPFRYDGIDIAPRFPSLYYLFPRVNHDHDGGIWDVTNGTANTPNNAFDNPTLNIYRDTTTAVRLAADRNLLLSEAEETTKVWLGDIDHRQPGNTKTGTSGAIWQADTLSGAPPLDIRSTTPSSAQYDPRELSPVRSTNPTSLIPQLNYSTATVYIPPEPYVVDPNIRGLDSTSDPTATVPSTFVYEKVNLANVEVLPRTLSSFPATNNSGEAWVLPSAAASVNPCRPTATVPNVILYGNPTTTSWSCTSIALQDKALFNGRELANTRVMDVNLDMLRRNIATGRTDTLLPASGIIYAFREDAVREDAITRPAATPNATNPYGTMNVVGAPTAPPWNPQPATIASVPRDPVLASNGISIKPVDYYGDPDRRPHGFRLRNGVDLRRALGSGFNLSDHRGMSFISDNPVYIQGDFNHHSNNGTANAANRLEEFTNTLETNWSDFYDRTGAQINTRFATAEQDSWRPTEIIADAITLLSNNFVDGNVEDFILNPNTDSSFRNRPSLNNLPTNLRWIRENPWPTPTSLTGAAAQNDLPILISRNGNPLYCDTPAPGAATYNPLFCPQPREYGISTSNGSVLTNTYGGSRALQNAAETRINAIIVSGIVPSRAQQSYGGFHNFPRFIQSWGGTPLNISGSFLQLNFSNYATAPFDQDAFEVGAPALAAETIPYYGAPDRRWGYDVGLLYAPAGPVSRRFVTVGTIYDQYYRELPVDDPYVVNLRCIQLPSGGRLDPGITPASCPS